MYWLRIYESSLDFWYGLYTGCTPLPARHFYFPLMEGRVLAVLCLAEERPRKHRCNLECNKQHNDTTQNAMKNNQAKHYATHEIA